MYHNDLIMIHECGNMLLVIELFMISGAVQGYDLEHIFTQTVMLSHTLTLWLAHMLQCFIFTEPQSQETAVDQQQLCHTAGEPN